MLALGLAQSRQRPGGNVTGLTRSGEELPGKRVEWLKAAAPSIHHIAVLRNPATPTTFEQWLAYANGAHMLSVYR